ncbi:ABC transporter ATP-binding protein [Algicella marina]|uniref:ATP-binding cassette domain-containing protein n=1 Tax=Algicella marina TaxID=2683284 RepID=A0A6P1T219_9RHOB|nr:ABC transporter ATP-binding protein [Algicella marina]QHQ36974.1 ATP-binding cassette domain-containing protein [Algicella marina]
MYRRFERLVDSFAPFDEKTPPANLFAYYRTQWSSFGRFVPYMAATGAAVAIMESGLLFYSGRLIDLMANAGPGAFLGLHMLELALVASFVILARPLLIGLHHLFLEQMLSGNLMDQARWRAHKHMLGQSMGYFQNDFAGRLSNRVMQLGSAVEDTTYMFFEAVWFASAYVIGAIIVVTGIDWRISLPLVIWVVVFCAYTHRIAKRVAVASEKWSDARSLVSGRVVDAYANIETVKLFAHGAREEAYARSSMKRHQLRFQRFLRLMTELQLGLNVINGILLVGMMVPAIWLWTAGTVTIGEVAVASALAIRLNGMSGWIMWVVIRLFEQAGVVREGLRSVSVPHAVTDRAQAGELKVTAGEIRFDGLTHHYGKDTGGLTDVNLTIPAGQKVGLVGRSGAGKSSLVNLLLRFRDVEQGRILIDGQDVGAVTQDSLRQAIGMVTQDSSLLHRSVRANILYGKPEATEAEMVEAAERAEAHRFIQDLEDPKGRRGYNAFVGERGVKLSGGQRQRIALARVILKDAPILILDEATSALDSEVEAAIQETLYGVMEGKTVIAIAHRLSTIAQMDRIIVLDHGRVVEDGSHEDLLSSGGLYAGLWARQSGGFLGIEAAE